MTPGDLIALPFEVDFLRNAMIGALLIAVPMGLLSCFLVLKGWSLMGDAVSHAVLPGIVLAYMAGLPLGLGAFLAGMTAALATGYLKENSRVKQDTVMGVVFSGMFALGLVLYTQIRTDVHLDHILFGDLLGLSAADLIESAAIGGGATVAILLLWRGFLVAAFDPVQAQASGLPLRALHYGLLVILALTIVAALKASGIILAIAMLIMPGATAFLLARRFPQMMALSVLAATGSSVGGIYLSIAIDSAPAPTIVLMMTIAFIAAFLRHSLGRPQPAALER